MITFNGAIDIRARQEKPQVAKFVVGNNVRYIVIGTDYGYLRTTGGDIRTWKSYSGAWKAVQRYLPL